MGRTSPAPDPALQRLREVAERIRRRAAEGRERAAARDERLAVDALPPRHWSDGPQDDGDDVTHH